MRFMQSAELSFKLDQVQKMAATPSVAAIGEKRKSGWKSADKHWLKMS